LLEAGILHLCSRSVVFDSNQIQTDLLRLPYDANFTFDNLSAETLQQVMQHTSMTGRQEASLYSKLYELLVRQMHEQAHPIVYLAETNLLVV
jgi:hypothetical protein